jgi:hypothetical protein
VTPSQLKRNAQQALRDFGEDVVVVVVGAADRQIRAIVERMPPALGNDGRRLDARLLIEVLNDAALGIDTGTLDLGTTRVRVAARIGQAVDPKGYAVTLPNADGDWQDAGMVTLGLK